MAVLVVGVLAGLLRVDESTSVFVRVLSSAEAS